MLIPALASSGRSCATATAHSSPRGAVSRPLSRLSSRAPRWPGTGRPLATRGPGATAWRTGPPARRRKSTGWWAPRCWTRREVLAQVGGFDEGYFMYSEELDWQRRVKQAGWHVVYLPDAIITHYEGKSSEQAVAARHIRFNRSKVRYFEKYHGRGAADALAACPVGDVRRRMGAWKQASTSSAHSAPCVALGWRPTGSCSIPDLEPR